MFFFNFRDLKQSDEGFYECQVNASPLLRHRIHLNVVGKLKIDIKKSVFNAEFTRAPLRMTITES